MREYHTYINLARELCSQYASRGHFLLQDILTAIEEGKASLMNAPAVPPSMNIDWMRAQLGISKLTSSGILERCLHAGSALYSNTPEEAFAKEVQNEITRDLLNIHVQHFFRNQFRRFVVIRAAAESAVSEINAVGQLENFAYYLHSTDPILVRMDHS